MLKYRKTVNCMHVYHDTINGPVTSKHSNRRSLLYVGSMAYLGRTTGRHRHGVGKGGGGEGTGGTNTGDRRDGDRRDREQTRNGGGRGGRVGGRRGSRGKENRWWGTLRRNRGSTEEEVLIKFSTYNIRNGRNGGLEAALRGMAQANMDLRVLQETKCTDGV